MKNTDHKPVTRLLRLCALASLAAFTALPAFADKEAAKQEAPQNVQTLQSVLAWTYINNPTLQSARAELKAVQEQLPQAYSNWVPSLNADAAITDYDIKQKPTGGIFGADGSTQKDIGLSFDQSLYRGGRTFSEIKAARYVINAQIAQLHAQEQSLLTQAAQAYMDVFRDRSLLTLAQNNRDVIAKDREATQDRFDVGELTKTDVSQAEARLASAKAEIITAKGNLRSSEAVFEQIIGFPPRALEYPYTELPFPENLETAISKAESHNPAVLSALNAHRASEKDIDSVFGELLPEIGLSGSVQRAYDPNPGRQTEQTTRAIGISASIPLYKSGSVRSRVRSAKHTANQRYMQILEQRRTTRQDVVRAWEDYESAKGEITAREAQIKASAVAREGVRAEAEFGSRTVLDTLDADQEYLDANVALVTAQRNKVVAEYQLLATLGDLTPQTLGFDKDEVNYREYMQGLEWRLFDMDVDRLGETP